MSQLTISRRAADIGLFGLMLVLSIAGFLITASFPSPLIPGYPGSAMFPRIVLVTMGVIAAFGLIRGLLARGMPTEAAPRVVLELPPFVYTVLALLGFALLLNTVGMEIAVFAFIFGAQWLRSRRFVVPLICGVSAVIVVYLLFVQALSVHLPLLFLPRYLFGF